MEKIKLPSKDDCKNLHYGVVFLLTYKHYDVLKLLLEKFNENHINEIQIILIIVGFRNNIFFMTHEIIGEELERLNTIRDNFFKKDKF